jgi:hypothetical protein
MPGPESVDQTNSPGYLHFTLRAIRSDEVSSAHGEEQA